MTPVSSAGLSVCAEPFGLALSPSGARLVVACLDGVVVYVDTTGANLAAVTTVNLRGAASAAGGALPPNAAAVAVGITNNKNSQDGDETVVVPLFYYEPVTVGTPADVDVSGLGVVALLNMTGTITRRVDLAPEADTSFGAGAFMNQLSDGWVQGDRAHVLALGAGPKGAPGPGASNTNPDAGPITVAQQPEFARRCRAPGPRPGLGHCA